MSAETGIVKSSADGQVSGAGWLDGVTEQLRREVAALVPADIVDREMIRVLTFLIEIRDNYRFD